MKAFPLVLLILFIFISGPLVTIWMLNTLFSVDIPYTLETWAAAFVLGAALYGPNARKELRDK
tara:strand:+ start:984 stop:1172 length:189 start_codon:yes stop_codon:yes gene_type:complete